MTSIITDYSLCFIVIAVLSVVTTIVITTSITIVTFATVIKINHYDNHCHYYYL